MSRHGRAENCVQQPSNVQLAAGSLIVAVLRTAASPVGCATPELKKTVKRTNATATSWILRKVITHIPFDHVKGAGTERLLTPAPELGAREVVTNIQLPDRASVRRPSGHAGQLIVGSWGLSISQTSDEDNTRTRRETDAPGSASRSMVAG